MFDKLFFHIDVNSAYLSWEAAYRRYHLGAKKDLREEVCAVGGDISMRHGIILAKSIKAGRHGISTGDSIFEAKQKCPQLMLVPPNYTLYEKASRAFISVLKTYTSEVEQYSIDEAFMAVYPVMYEGKTPQILADEIRKCIKSKLGFTVNIGIGENKLLAKMAGDLRKPDQVHTIFSWEIREKMWPLSVDKLFFVGRAACKKLKLLGIHTIGELAQTDVCILKSHLKKQGEIIWQFANGLDCSVLMEPLEEIKGCGNSVTLPFDVSDAKTAKTVLLSLAENVGRRLRKESVEAGIVSVGIKNSNFFKTEHQKLLKRPTSITEVIYKQAAELFDEAWNGFPIRHLSMRTGKIEKSIGSCQLDLFEDIIKRKRAEEAVDTVRRRYGRDAVMRAVFLGSRLEHMCGGVSREKYSVDYSKIKIM